MKNNQQTALEVARQESQELLLSLEGQKTLTDHEVASMMDRALKKLDGAEASEEEKTPWIYEVRLWITSPYPVFSQSNQETKAPRLSERFGDLAKNKELFPPEADGYFKSRFRTSQSPFLKARYADFLAVRCALENTDKDAARNWVLEAVPLYLQNVISLSASAEVRYHIESFESLDSAAHLAVCKAPDLLPSVSQSARQLLEVAAQEVAVDEEQKPLRYGRWALELGEILLAIRRHTQSAVCDADLKWWQLQAQHLAEKNAGLNEPFLEERFWTQAAQAAALLGLKNEQFAALKECANAKVRAAYARAQGKGASALAAAGLLENAVDYLDHLRGYATNEVERQEITEKQRRLKLEIPQFYIKGKEEFGWSRVPFDVTPEQIEDVAAQFVEPADLKECLQRLGSSLLPDVQQAELWAQSQVGNESISSLVGTSLIGDGLEIRSYNTEEEKKEFERNRAYEFQFHLNNKVLLPAVWEKLRAEKELDASLLLAYLDESGLIGERNYRLVQAGIERYFAQDFAAALHLLVPQLEDVIRRLFERIGIPAIKQSKGGNGWEFETFGAFLRRIDKQLNGTFPPELRVYVERILSDPTGWNLRNQIAHGLISFAECNRLTTETVLHIYLSFSLFEEIPKTENSHVTTASTP